MYTVVYNLSAGQIESYPPELYRRYTESIQKYLSERVVPLLAGLTDAELL